MEAAAHGRSTLGIPKKVAQEFVAADTAKAKRKPAKRNPIVRAMLRGAK